MAAVATLSTTLVIGTPLANFDLSVIACRPGAPSPAQGRDVGIEEPRQITRRRAVRLITSVTWVLTSRIMRSFASAAGRFDGQ